MAEDFLEEREEEAEPNLSDTEIDLGDVAAVLDEATHGEHGFGSPENTCPCAESEYLTVDVMLACLDDAANGMVTDAELAEDAPPPAAMIWLEANMADKLDEASTVVTGWQELFAADPTTYSDRSQRLRFPEDTT